MVIFVRWFVKDKATHKVISYILLAIVLTINVPSYWSTYTYELQLDIECERTQQDILQLLGNDDIILTNVSHFDWSILEYYFPNNLHFSAEKYGYNFENDRQYWLFWGNELTEEEQMWLDDADLFYEEIICYGLIGTERVHVYKLMR